MAISSITGFKMEINDVLIRAGVSLLFEGKKYIRSFRALKIDLLRLSGCCMCHQI